MSTFKEFWAREVRGLIEDIRRRDERLMTVYQIAKGHSGKNSYPDEKLAPDEQTELDNIADDGNTNIPNN